MKLILLKEKGKFCKMQRKYRQKQEVVNLANSYTMCKVFK